MQNYPRKVHAFCGTMGEARLCLNHVTPNPIQRGMGCAASVTVGCNVCMRLACCVTEWLYMLGGA
jgi:hypothetical protein